MPKPTAVMLSWNTIEKISDVLAIPKQDVENEWHEMVIVNENQTRLFYVQDCLFMGSPMHYMIYNERDFLANFASVPPGIETELVPVTQVKT